MAWEVRRNNLWTGQVSMSTDVDKTHILYDYKLSLRLLIGLGTVVASAHSKAQ